MTLFGKSFRAVSGRFVDGIPPFLILHQVSNPSHPVTNEPSQTATPCAAEQRTWRRFVSDCSVEGWNPMKKQGATYANPSIGTFYLGAIVTGYLSDATENAVQANIVATGYGN